MNAQTPTVEALQGERFLTGTQKCAILMMLLGEDEAAALLKHLTPREVQHLGTAMFSVADVDQGTVKMVLDEFLMTAKAQTSLGQGSGPYIRNVLVKALGEDKAGSVLNRITPTTSRKSMEILEWMDARSIAQMVANEHPQIIAIVISHLDFALGADVLQLLPEDVQADVMHRIATLEAVDPEAIAELEQVMQKQFTASSSIRSSSVGGVRAAAKIMNFMRTANEQRIMRSLGELDRTLTQDIRENMFVFDNLLNIDDKSMQTLLRSVEAELLVVALKGADERLKAKVFSCMSQRAAANIMDELEAKGPLRVSEVQEAQKKIVALARKLSDSGAIVLAGRGDDFV